jgi:hypothetical protein
MFVIRGSVALFTALSALAPSAAESALKPLADTGEFTVLWRAFAPL